MEQLTTMELKARWDNNDDETVDRLGYLRMMDTQLLLAAAKGQVDLNEVARWMVADRGIGINGAWVGFPEAHRQMAALSTPIDAEEAIGEIAATKLGIETLDTRKSDSLDFHELAVWTLRSALAAAYEAGAAAQRAELVAA